MEKDFRVFNSSAENAQSSAIATAYNLGVTNGWDQTIAQEAFKVVGNDNPQIYNALPANMVANAAGKKMFLYRIVRQFLGKDTKNYPQQIGDPFVAGTMVVMADGGEKRVEDIKIGDVVINHKGEKAVVHNTIKKNFTGDLVTVKLRGWHREITATETHHGMILPYTQKRFQYSGCERMKFGEMKVGDYMLISNGLQGNEDNILDICKYVNDVEFDDNYVWYREDKKINRFIKVDSNFGRLLGLYLAEGGLSSGGITFSLHVKETLLAEEITTLGQDIFNVKVTKQKTGCDNCVRISFNSRVVKNFFGSFVKGNIYSKSIPPVIFLAKKSCRLSVIRGWLDGDGHKNFKQNAVIGYTSSNVLGDDMARLAVSCGIKINSWRRFRKVRASKENTEIGFYGTEAYQVYDDVAVVKKSKTISCNDTPHGFARPIKSITRRSVVDEEVYCITTENEYTAIFNGIANFQCVSFGAKNATEYLICCERIIKGTWEKFRPVFPPYFYGTSRVQVGGGQLGNGDGSTGSWMAEAVIKYGVLAADESGVPEYSGSVAKSWGRSGSPDNFVKIAQAFPIKSAVKINSWAELVAAITNGYPCTVASNQGFSMEAGSDGFHRAQGNWGHQMCIMGVDDEYANPYGLILNSWGDAMGHLKSFDTPSEDIPIGVIRAHKNTIEDMISAGETFAYSNFDGFPEQDLDEALFKIVGK